MYFLFSFGAMVFLNVAGQIWDLYDTEVRPLFAPLLLIVFVAGALMNIGKVLGEDRDYKAFFFSIGRYVLAAFVIIGVAELLRTYSLS